jgi:hypothetical protein
MRRETRDRALGRAIGLSSSALPLRDSAGFSPDFPRLFQLRHDSETPRTSYFVVWIQIIPASSEIVNPFMKLFSFVII